MLIIFICWVQKKSRHLTQVQTQCRHLKLNKMDLIPCWYDFQLGRNGFQNLLGQTVQSLVLFFKPLWHMPSVIVLKDIFGNCWIPRCLISGTQVWKHSFTCCPLSTTQVCCFQILESYYINCTEISSLSTLFWFLCFRWNNTPCQMRQPCLQMLQRALCNVLQPKTANSVNMQLGFCGSVSISCIFYRIFLYKLLQLDQKIAALFCHE